MMGPSGGGAGGGTGAGSGASSGAATGRGSFSGGIASQSSGAGMPEGGNPSLVPANELRGMAASVQAQAAAAAAAAAESAFLRAQTSAAALRQHLLPPQHHPFYLAAGAAPGGASVYDLMHGSGAGGASSTAVQMELEQLMLQQRMNALSPASLMSLASVTGAAGGSGLAVPSWAGTLNSSILAGGEREKESERISPQHRPLMDGSEMCERGGKGKADKASLSSRNTAGSLMGSLTGEGGKGKEVVNLSEKGETKPSKVSDAGGSPKNRPPPQSLAPTSENPRSFPSGQSGGQDAPTHKNPSPSSGGGSPAKTSQQCKKKLQHGIGPVMRGSTFPLPRALDDEEGRGRPQKRRRRGSAPDFDEADYVAPSLPSFSSYRREWDAVQQSLSRTHQDLDSGFARKLAREEFVDVLYNGRLVLDVDTSATGMYKSRKSGRTNEAKFAILHQASALNAEDTERSGGKACGVSSDKGSKLRSQFLSWGNNVMASSSWGRRNERNEAPPGKGTCTSKGAEKQLSHEEEKTIREKDSLIRTSGGEADQTRRNPRIIGEAVPSPKRRHVRADISSAVDHDKHSMLSGKQERSVSRRVEEDKIDDDRTATRRSHLSKGTTMLSRRREVDFEEQSTATTGLLQLQPRKAKPVPETEFKRKKEEQEKHETKDEEEPSSMYNSKRLEGQNHPFPSSHTETEFVARVRVKEEELPQRRSILDGNERKRQSSPLRSGKETRAPPFVSGSKRNRDEEVIPFRSRRQKGPVMRGAAAMAAVGNRNSVLDRSKKGRK